MAESGKTLCCWRHRTPPTSIVNEPAVLAAHGVLLLENAHEITLQQRDIQVLGCVEIAVCLEEFLRGVPGQEGSSEFIRLQHVAGLEGNKTPIRKPLGLPRPSPRNKAEETHWAQEWLPPGRLVLHAPPIKGSLGNRVGLREEGKGLELLENSAVLLLEDGDEVPLPASHSQQLEQEQRVGSCHQQSAANPETR